MDETAFSKLSMADRKSVLRLAELKVRAGEAPISVRRALGIPETTFVRAASLGRWRLKDLEREDAGLDPLPLPASLTSAEQKTGSCPIGQSAGEADNLIPAEEDGVRDLSSLLERAKACGAQALNYFHSGHRAKAEAKLKEAETLTRLHRRLAAHLPPEPTEAEQEQKMIDAMSNEELVEEIKRLAGI